MREAGVVEHFEVIGVKLFGDDAYRDPGMPPPWAMKAELGKLLSTIVAEVWNKARKLAGISAARGL